MAIKAESLIIKLIGKDQFSKVFSKAEGKMNIFRKRIGSISAVGALGLAGIGIAAAKMSADFDTAMRKVNVMARAGSEEFGKMKKDVLNLSSSVGISASNMADAMYVVVSAGFRGADAMKTLKGIALGAAGGMADVKQTAEAVAKALTIFGLSGEKSTWVMDRFFGIVDKGLLSFEELTGAFPRAAAQAGVLGVSFDEVGAALAVLTKTAASTEEAATALNGTMTALAKPSEDMENFIKNLGFATAQTAIESIGFVGILKEVEKRYGGNADALAKLFPNIRALRAVLPLVTTGSEDFDDALESLERSTGRTGDAFKEMAEGPGFKFRQATTKMKNSMILMGESLYFVAEALAWMMDKLIPAIKGFKALGPAIGKMALAMDTWVSRVAVKTDRMLLKIDKDNKWLQEDLRKTEERVMANVRAFNELDKELFDVIYDLDEYRDANKSASEIIEEHTKKQKELENALSDASSQMENFGDTAQKTGEETEKEFNKVIDKMIGGLQKLEDRFWGFSDEEISALQKVVDYNKQKMEIMEFEWENYNDLTKKNIEFQKKYSEEYKEYMTEVEKAELRMRQIRKERVITPTAKVIKWAKGARTFLTEKITELGLTPPELTYPRLPAFAPTPQQAIQNFNFNFSGAFIGNIESFKKQLIDLINRESELRALGGE